jgi:DNA-binding response OmpR family regulator
MASFAFPWKKKSKKVKILMVDDEVSFTRLTKRTLEMHGRFEVHTVNRAREALAAAEAFEPDVILLDVLMPDGDGTEIAAQIVDHPKLRHAHIIFLTAMVSGVEADRAHGEIGGRLYIAKPVQFEVLTERIEELLRGRLRQ